MSSCAAKADNGAHQQILCILPHWTVRHIVLLRIIEHELKVLADIVKGLIGASFDLRLDVIEGNGALDEDVVVGI